MKRVLTAAALALGTVVATMGVAAPAYAGTIDVVPGQSIQAAVNKAQPGDVIIVHPGTYHEDRKSTRLNSSHQIISYAVFCLKKKTLHLQSTPALELLRGTNSAIDPPSPHLHCHAHA